MGATRNALTRASTAGSARAEVASHFHQKATAADTEGVVPRSAPSEIHRRDRLGGLIHEYYQRAA
jgi:hypothetical protein